MQSQQQGGERMVNHPWTETSRVTIVCVDDNRDGILGGRIYNGGALADGALAYGDSENVTGTFAAAYAPEAPVEIPDEEVPKADVPQTGDPILIYVGMTALSGLGLLGLGLKKKDEDTE